MMDIFTLSTFIKISETGSITRAAESLFVSQPTVSKRLAQLESQIGHLLFDRLGKTLQLTEAGRTLLPHARQVLAELDRGKRALDELGGTVGGKLRIGTSHHIGLHRLPPVLKAFVAEYPAVELDIRFLDSEDACAAVQSGELELGIVTLPPQPLPYLAQRLIWPDPMAVMVSASHPLQTATWTEVCRYPALLPDAHTYTHRLIQHLLLEQGLQPKVLLSTNYLETLKMLVGIGLGWSVLPLSMQGDLRVIPVLEPPLQRELGVVWHSARSLSRAAGALLAMLIHPTLANQP
jgi:DNA-binding transcriptional LysR family regulator